MLKKILIFTLIVAMLSLSSCRIVEIINHDLFVREEAEEPKKEYEPWGYWHSYEASMAVKLTQGSDKAILYYLTTGYYEYSKVIEAACTYDGDSTFVLTLEDNKTLSFVFNKFNNTMTYSQQTYTPVEKAPLEHLEYAFPNYAELNPAAYVAVGDIDFAPVTKLVFEGAPYNIAMTYYGHFNKFPLAEGISRKAQSGDVVNIDYKGTLDGVAFEGGTASGVTLFISDYANGYVPGFTEGIIGHEIGETFDVPVTFPENYAPDLAGKDVIFTMTLNGICDMTLTDEQVAEYKSNSYTTYSEWLLDEQFEVTTELFAAALLKATTTNSPIPSNVYLYYYQQTMDYYHLVAYYYGIDFSLLMNYYGLSETTVMQEALNQATYNMALWVLKEQKGLAWTNEEFTQKYDALVADYLEANKGVSNEEAVAYADGMKSQLELNLAEEKALVWAFDKIFPKESIQEGEIDFAALSYVAFGDSITKGADHNNNYEPMEYPYPKLVGESLKLKSVQNLASSGATFCANENGNVCMTDRITSYTDEADIISVWLGFNDWARSFPLGSIEDKTNATIYGCLNLIAEHLTTVHKNAFVFFMTPYKTSLIRNEDYTLPEVVTAIKEVCTIYDIPILDMYNMGNFELEMYDEISDGVHPTPEFVRKYTAPQITKFIKENFPK